MAGTPAVKSSNTQGFNLRVGVLIGVTVAVLFVTGFVLGVSYAHGMEPYEWDTNLDNYYQRLDYGYSLFGFLGLVGLFGSIAAIWSLYSAYQARGHSWLIECWLLLVVAAFLTGASAGFLLTIMPWLANR